MADALDILDAAEALLAINRGTAPTDLPLMVTSVSRVIDDVCGPVVVRTVTAELHHGGAPTVHLKQRPVSSVTTVREVESPGTVNTLDAVAWGADDDGYFAEPLSSDPTFKSGAIHRKVSGFDADWLGSGLSVEVTYQAGRYANTAAVDEKFKGCASAVLRRLWRREAGAWSQSPTFLEGAEDDAAERFYRAVRPIIEELLPTEVQARGFGVA